MSKKDIPKYTSIAIDIAHNIFNETYCVGDKLRGRSTLSSKYEVSPETIRKAVALLNEMNVVSVNEKSGIIVKSKEMAYLFIEKYNSQINIKLLHQKIDNLLKEKNSIDEQIKHNLDLILDYTLKYEQNLITSNKQSCIDTIDIELKESHHIINKSISETEFFKYTNATIVSVERDGTKILSPGPFFVFKPLDILSLVCSEENIEKTKRFIENANK